MNKPKVAVVVISIDIEDGGERWESLLKDTSAALKSQDIDVVEQSRMVWTPKDAVIVANELKAKDVDMVVLVHATWVQDTIQYIFVNKLNVPVMLLAVPYIETFSLACVNHFASILKRRNIPFSYTYSMPNEEPAITRMRTFAFAAMAAKKLKNATFGMIGPRQTWRIAGAQDMVSEEWDFSKIFGTTILHIEMSELLDIAKKIPAEEVASTLNSLKAADKIGEILTDDKHVNFAASVYLAVKKLKDMYGLDFASAQCYPEFGGSTNLAASVLADEGFVLDTEGDASHAALLFVMMMFGKNQPACLSEPGGLEQQDNFMYLEHEGSSPLSLADKSAPITVNECGDGTMVGFSLAPMPKVTLANICAYEGTMVLTLASGSTIGVDKKVWEGLGGRFLGAFQTDGNIMDFHSALLEIGTDHHFALKKGDIYEEISEFCKIIGIECIQI